MRLLKMVLGEAAGEIKAGGVASGYVEDFDEPRTKPKAIFSSR
jgi:hypothetical protein